MSNRSLLFSTLSLLLIFASIASAQQKLLTVEDIFDRVRETVERTVGGSMVEVNRALGQLVKAVYRTGWKVDSDEARKRVADILAKAAAEIEELAKAPAGA